MSYYTEHKYKLAMDVAEMKYKRKKERRDEGEDGWVGMIVGVTEMNAGTMMKIGIVMITHVISPHPLEGVTRVDKML